MAMWPRSARRRFNRGVASLLLASALAIAAVGCGGEPPPPAPVVLSGTVLGAGASGAADEQEFALYVWTAPQLLGTGSADAEPMLLNDAIEVAADGTFDARVDLDLLTPHAAPDGAVHLEVRAAGDDEGTRAIAWLERDATSGVVDVRSARDVEVAG